MARRKLIAGNWKMNGLREQLREIDDIVEATPEIDADLVICPPATLLAACASRASDSALVIGGQDCHAEPKGAHTGDLSAEMLADAGAQAVILGHSERRADHGETDAMVRAKVEAAWRAGLTAIVCVGETEAERDSGATFEVLAESLADSLPKSAKLENTVIAYEPVWAIGTGHTPSIEQIGETHAFIRSTLRERLGKTLGDGVRILYGGSVKPDNARAVLSPRDVDGALVGGASLKAADFLAIARAG